MTKKTIAEVQQNKQHKTLRDKLKKRRQEDKKHKKQKKLKKLSYDPTLKKDQFFSQRNTADKEGEIKQIKITKYIKKFINIYQDDLEDFFSIFQSFDNKQQVDIQNVQNTSLRKCFKKIFKCLPLKKQKMVYQKKQTSINLNSYMRIKVASIIQQYLQNGSQNDSSQIVHSSSQQNQSKIPKQPNTKKYKKSELKIQPLQIQKINQIQQQCIGPSITLQQRSRIQQIFSNQLTNKNREIQNYQNQQFEKIFAMSTQRESKKKVPKMQEVPQHLMAQGSAKLGERLDIDDDYLEKYNREFRPKKLIEQHRELMKNGNNSNSLQKKDRKPFDRQRDVVNGEKRSLMNNGVFFDFKDRMTKPKNTNTFL